jgi:hypothetical protein
VSELEFLGYISKFKVQLENNDLARSRMLASHQVLFPFFLFFDICIYTYTHAYIYTHVCVFVSVCVCVCVCVYIYIHT